LQLIFASISIVLPVDPRVQKLRADQLKAESIHPGRQSWQSIKMVRSNLEIRFERRFRNDLLAGKASKH
jgi:hypothetical protein